VHGVKLQDNFNEVVLYSPAVWPGAIVSAQSVILTGVPDPLVVPRAPLTVEVLGAGLTNASKVVAAPSAGAVEGAINDLLCPNPPGPPCLGSRDARISARFVKASSREQVEVELKLPNVIKNFGGGFDFDHLEEKSSLFVEVFQIFYTVQINDAASGLAYLGDGVPCDDLLVQLPPNIPDVPAVITSAKYGRILLFQMTTSREVTKAQLELAFRKAIPEADPGATPVPDPCTPGSGSGSDSLEGDLCLIFERSDRRLLLLGGDPEAGSMIFDPSLEQLREFFRRGHFWSFDFRGVPLSYVVNEMTCGVRQISYGLTTDFQLHECSIRGGDNLWNVREFACDFGHDNSFTLQRDGTPVCGSGNCGGPPNSCWGPVRKAGNTDGSLSLPHGQDRQVYGDTYLYVTEPRIISVPVTADVGAVWLNDVQIISNPLSLSLEPGCNHLEFTSYNQNQATSFNIQAALADLVIRMDSAGCEP
jgi:hypothetical protein